MIKKRLEDLQVGDKVWCGCDSGFCHDSIKKVKEIKTKFNKNSGKPYKVIVLKGGQEFSSKDGGALTPPTAYYIEIPEERDSRTFVNIR